MHRISLIKPDGRSMQLYSRSGIKAKQINPPMRSKEKLKFLAGTELGAGVFVNDSLPEEKAAELKAVNSE